MTLNLYERAVVKYGADSQVKKTIEECAELIVVLSHYADGKVSIDDVADEVADVEIMMKQMRVIIGNQIVDYKRAYKAARLDGMLTAQDES